MNSLLLYFIIYFMIKHSFHYIIHKALTNFTSIIFVNLANRQELIIQIISMSISLILIGIISVIVILGTGYLLQAKNEQLTQKKKTMIMLIVGSVIFVSFIVTSMKHPTLLQINSKSNSNYNLNHLFFPQNCKYGKDTKYANHVNLPLEVISQIYARNYLSINKRPHTQNQQDQVQQNILFLSQKDEGVSYFLAQLADRTCKDSHPTLYAKLTGKIQNEDDFVKILGFNSYQQFVNSVCHLSGIEVKKISTATEYTIKLKTNKKPYLIIDNFQHLIDALSEQTRYIEQAQQQDNIKRRKYTTKQRLISKIINQLMGNCKANLIFNTQDDEAIETIYQIWQQSNLKRQLGYFPFQFHNWQGMRHYDIYKIIIKIVQNSDYIVSQILQNNKKDTYNFNDIYTILKQVQSNLANSKGQTNAFKRQDAILKQSNIKTSVARYFGLAKTYKELRSAQVKAISYFRQKIGLTQILRLQKLNLISIRNGKIFIQ